MAKASRSCHSFPQHLFSVLLSAFYVLAHEITGTPT